MLEYFTDRAKRVLELAKQQADRRNHAKAQPAHLLLAILAEGQGMAIAVLQKFRVDIKIFRDDVDRALQGLSPQMQIAGPGLDSIIQTAYQRAQEWEHGFASTVHLLLALMSTDDSIVRKTFQERDLSLDEVEEDVCRLLGSGDDEDAPRKIGQLLADLLTQCGVADGRWFAPLSETLDDVSFEEALYKPVPELLNTWQHVLHVRSWCEYASCAVRGRPLPDSAGEWPQPSDDQDPAEWEQARHDLAEALANLREDLLWLKDRVALQTSSEPTFGSRALVAAGAITHIAYHNGQVRLLLGMRSWTEDGRAKQWSDRTKTQA